jgi:hypothetical protein
MILINKLEYSYRLCCKLKNKNQYEQNNYPIILDKTGKINE